MVQTATKAKGKKQTTYNCSHKLLIFIHRLMSHKQNYEGCSMNKLQNDIILLIFKM